MFLSGLHGKLTGAGGGGFAFAFIPPSLPEKSLALIKESLENSGYTCCTADVGGTGMTVNFQESQSE